METVTENAEQTVEDLKRAIAALDKLIKIRNDVLSHYEKIAHKKILNGEVSLMNISGQKGKVVKITRGAPTLQMECRIWRRNLFHLVHRRNSLQASLDGLQQERESSLAG